MARPLRVEYPGAVYHVLSRGVGRQDVFHHDSDYETFLSKLAENASSFKVQVRSYCLMTNHFHLYLQTEEANLSQFMQAFLSAYSIIKNRRDQRRGHLFEARFKAHVVEEDGYGNILSRYIHLNPVRIQSAKKLPADERQRLLREYRWSSYAAVIGLRRCPQWLKRQKTLLTWGSSLKEKQANYAEYVEQGLLREVTDPFEGAAAQCVIGSDDFVDKIRRLYLQVSDQMNLRRDQTQAMHLRSWVSFEEVQSLVAKVYTCTPESLLKRYQRGNEGRQMLLYVASKYCRGRYTLAEISEQLDISLGGMTSGRYAFQQRLNRSSALRKQLRQIERRLNAKTDG
jgi:putative transposase